MSDIQLLPAVVEFLDRPHGHFIEGKYLAGEAGPEYVSIRNRSQGLGGPTINLGGISIYSPGLNDADLHRLGPKIFREISLEARRRGGRLLN